MMTEHYSQILVEFFERMSSWEQGIVAGREISLPQMHLIEVVGNHDRIRMKDLAARLGVTTGTLTVMVHRLVTRGYLRKEKDPEDNRSSFVSMSEKGQREYQNHHHLHDISSRRWSHTWEKSAPRHSSATWNSSGN